MASTIRTLRIERDLIPSGARPAGMGSLLVIAGHPADIGTHLVVEREVVLGRESSGLLLRDGRISRRHARVSKESDGRHLLIDLASTNGTTLNGRWVEVPSHLGDGDKIGLGNTVVKFTLVDATEADYLRRIAQLARTDPLTGLHAKHRFDELLAEAFGQASGDAPVSVLMMDLDGLKAINDQHGHHVGANTIATVGRLIGTLVAGRGEACRFGGDEFCVYLPASDLPRAVAFAEQLRLAVEETPCRHGDVEVRASISIGVACWTPECEGAEALVVAADRALYRAKAAGRNAVAT